MKTLIVLCVIAAILIAVVFAGYAITTTQIIRQQEREIDELRKSLHRSDKRGVSDDTIRFGGF